MPPHIAHLAALATLLALASRRAAAAAAPSAPRWGTLRPQSLISARLPLPHSPHIGVLYHPAGSREVRHVAEAHRDAIRSFAFVRHTAELGEQRIDDIGANVRLVTSLYAPASSKNVSTFALRVSATPLDDSKPVPPLSLVFYAATGPDDVLDGEKGPRDWGSVALPIPTMFAPDDAATLTLATPALPEPLPITLYAPRGGDLAAPADPGGGDGDGDDALAGSASLGSRARRRVRAARPPSMSDDLAAFRVAAFNPAAGKAWAVEKELAAALQPATDPSARLAGAARPQLLSGPAGGAGKGAVGAFVQRIASPPFSLDVAGAGAPSGSALDAALESARAEFDTRFEHVFGLAARGVPAGERAFARDALAGLLGGVGFFYGSSEMERGDSAARDGRTEMLPPVSLLTATPSRALFPRGFLWDEGFHQLLILRWDAALSRRCLSSWFAAARPSGWIPREQVLGLEARARFPAHVRHLMLQNPEVANPPTILIPLQLLWQAMVGADGKCAQAGDGDGAGGQRCAAGAATHPDVAEELETMFTRVEKYYRWLKESQAGTLPNSFRWRGRSMRVKAPQGYPLTLSSGLDDYPRGDFPRDTERHVDLHAWVAWSARMLARISELRGKDASDYWRDFEELHGALLQHHGVPAENASSDEDLLLCDYDGEERVCHEGYVTILPLALGLLDVGDARVGGVLDALEDGERLRADAGVRSLSKRSRWYRKGDDYWTGSVWMPFNYLTLAALHTKYGTEDGPFRERARTAYDGLRARVLRNAHGEYARTGQLWENYSPDDGRGKSGRQFTGWSSLVLLIYAEMFEGVAS